MEAGYLDVGDCPTSEILVGSLVFSEREVGVEVGASEALLLGKLDVGAGRLILSELEEESGLLVLVAEPVDVPESAVEPPIAAAELVTQLLSLAVTSAHLASEYAWSSVSTTYDFH